MTNVAVGRLKLVRWCVLGFVGLTIFHALPPGSPQPADLLIMLLISIFLRRGWIHYTKGEKILIVFTGYTYLVNLVWSAILGDLSVLVPPLYFTFNVLAFAIFKKYFEDERNLPAVLMATMLALLAEAFFTLTRTGAIRATGTFENPNALAYFAICYTAIGLLIADRLKRAPWVHALILLMGWVLTLFSLSKAGLGAMIFMTLILLFRVRLVYALWGLAASAGAIYFVFLEQIELAIERMNAIGEDKDDSLEGRGYDRIINDIQHTILGAGEGAYWRHDSVWKGEIHSTFGTLLFCYGIVGLGLFCVFLYYVYRVNRVSFLLYLTPVFVYSFTHNGLRATPFWILLALLAVRRPRRTQSAVPLSAGRHLPVTTLDAS